MTRSVQIEGSLSEEKLNEFCAQLTSLPTPKEFKQQAEADLWRIVTGGSELESNDSVTYEDLPESSKQLIGTIESDGNRVPWWLNDFDWMATSPGAEEITLSESQDLSIFEKFAPEQAVIKKPRLRNHNRSRKSNDIYDALNNFEEIQKELKEHLNVGEEKDELYLPDEIFIQQDKGIRTTTEFQDWFNSVITLCPPFNEQLTALLMLNSKAKFDLARENLPEEIVASIKNLGLVTNGEIHNSAFFQQIASKPYFGSESSQQLLRYDWKVFDLEVPYIYDEYDHLTPLEAALFESWVEDNKEFAEKHTDYLMNTTISSQTEYTRVGQQAPVTKERGKSKFVTLTQTKDKSLSAHSARKVREMRDILRKHGIEDD
jgi:hypothetical protein